MAELAKRKCIPCMGGVPPLKGNELKKLHNQLGSSWQLVNEHHIEKEYSFNTFKEALAFTNNIGELAEEEGHHPEINLAFRKVKLTLWTHKIDGLTESDFIFAAKSDEVFKQ